MPSQYVKIIFQGEQEELNKISIVNIRELFANNDILVKAIIATRLTDAEIEEDGKASRPE